MTGFQLSVLLPTVRRHYRHYRQLVKEPEFSNPSSARHFMLWLETQEQELELVEFELEWAIASVASGQPAIPIWLDAIH